MKRSTRTIMLASLARALVDGTPFSNENIPELHLPEISPDERIRYHGQKIRKHVTKHRRNKLHDKITRKR
jgi:hypothetical protein